MPKTWKKGIVPTASPKPSTMTEWVTKASKEAITPKPTEKVILIGKTREKMLKKSEKFGKNQSYYLEQMMEERPEDYEYLMDGSNDDDEDPDTFFDSDDEDNWEDNY